MTPAAQPRAVIVADLGFGDSGKGLATDALVRRLHARSVVRYNGGAQAGHNVVTPDGRHHTFSQFGAGTFVPGVRTFLSRHMAVHPTGLLVESSHLARAGVTDALERIFISEDALLITPFHQAAGRLRELARGAARHGSCGLGVGEAVGDARLGGALVMKDLADRRGLRPKLLALREQKLAEMRELLALMPASPQAAAERRVLEDPAVIADWSEAAQPLIARIASDDLLGDWLREDAAVVFEGAQGVLLDERHGFHPYTTWSNCTFDNATGLLREQDYGRPIQRLGVLRAYLLRHGPGPFPTEEPGMSERLAEAHNVDGPWQGAVRAGWLDWPLLRYALQACGGADGLALTHLDALPKLPAWRAALSYEGCGALTASFDYDLARQAGRTRLLAKAKPVYQGLRFDSAEGFAGLVEEALGVPIVMTSSGPTADSVAHKAPSTEGLKAGNSFPEGP